MSHSSVLARLAYDHFAKPRKIDNICNSLQKITLPGRFWKMPNLNLYRF